MKIQDVIIGRKYIPFQKTIGDIELFTKRGEWSKAKAKGQPFLYCVNKLYNDHIKNNVICLSSKISDPRFYDGYASEDIIEYDESKFYPDETFLKEVYAIADEKQQKDMEEKFPSIFKEFT